MTCSLVTGTERESEWDREGQGGEDSEREITETSRARSSLEQHNQRTTNHNNPRLPHPYSSSHVFSCSPLTSPFSYFLLFSFLLSPLQWAHTGTSTHTSITPLPYVALCCLTLCLPNCFSCDPYKPNDHVTQQTKPQSSEDLSQYVDVYDSVLFNYHMFHNTWSRPGLHYAMEISLLLLNFLHQIEREYCPDVGRFWLTLTEVLLSLQFPTKEEQEEGPERELLS